MKAFFNNHFLTIETFSFYDISFKTVIFDISGVEVVNFISFSKDDAFLKAKKIIKDLCSLQKTSKVIL